MTAIYHQQTKSLQQEWLLVELCTKREKYCDDLKKIINEVKENRRKEDDFCMCQTFELMLMVRQTTFDLIKAIRLWQKGFTALKRPQLMERDYMIDIIETGDFINSCMIRKKFNFLIGRGNIFILPIKGNPNTPPPVQVSARLKALVDRFAAVSDDDLQIGYQTLINSLPPEHYARVAQCSRFIENPWVPNILLLKGHEVASGAEGEVLDRPPLSEEEMEARRIAQERKKRLFEIKNKPPPKLFGIKQKLSEQQVKQMAIDAAKAKAAADKVASENELVEVTRSSVEVVVGGRTVKDTAMKMSFSTGSLRSLAVKVDEKRELDRVKALQAEKKREREALDKGNFD